VETPAWRRKLPWVNGSIYTFDFNGADAAGNAATQVESTGVIFDTDLPTLLVSPPVHIVSNNSMNTAYAKPGDTVTLTFTSSEPINPPTVTIAGQPATVLPPSGNSYTATYLMATGTNGVVPFSIAFQRSGRQRRHDGYHYLGRQQRHVREPADGYQLLCRQLPTRVVPGSDNITNATAPIFNMAFSEAVLGFDNGDLSNAATTGAATGCTFAIGATSTNTYPVTVSGCSQGTLILSIAASSVTDAVGNTNQLTNGATVTIDRTAPVFSSSTQAMAQEGLPPTSTVTINWNKFVDCTTVNTTNVTISPGTWTRTSCTNSGSAGIAVLYTERAGAIPALYGYHRHRRGGSGRKTR